MTGVTSSGLSTSSPFSAILVQAGLANTNSNTIGSQSATGSLVFSTNSTSATDVHGIYNFSSDNWTANSNNIGGISVTNAAASGTYLVYGMRANTGTAVTFNASTNNIGGTVANSIQLASTGAASQVIGCYTVNAKANWTSNTVRNLTNNNGTGTGGSASVIGISVVSTGVGNTLSQNTVYNLSNSHVSAAVLVTGIHYSGATTGTNTIERNFIYGLKTVSSSASSIITGMNALVGLFTIKNNVVALGNDASGSAITAGVQIIGIDHSSSTSNNIISFNSVYIGGTGVNTVASDSYAFRCSAAGSTRTFQNNIFSNVRTNSSTGGVHYVLKLSNIGSLTMDYNDLYFTGTGNKFNYGGLFYTDIAGWRTGTTKDANSISANPNFNNPTAATPDLSLSSSGSPCDVAGILVAAFTDDFLGLTRSSNTPTDMGAYSVKITPSCSTTPTPSDLATAISQTTGLSWTTATNATSYNIYFGTDNAPTNIVNGTNQAGLTYNPASALAANTDYYWQIVPVRAGVTAIGCPVWKFTTQGATPSLSVATSAAAFGNQCQNVASSANSFTISGVNLTGTFVTITAPTDFTVSEDNITFASSINVNHSSGSFTNKTIYVKFTPTTATAYSANVVISGGGLSADVNALVTGTGLAASTPTVSISASPSTTFCAGANVTFTAVGANLNSTSVTNYQWFVNSSSVQSSASATYASTGFTNSQTVYCVITTSAGCVTTTSATSPTSTLTVNAIPVVSVSSSINSYCGSTPLALTGNGATTYTWSPVTDLYTDAAGTVAYVALANATVVYSKAQSTLNYTATGTTSGCSSTGSKSIAKGAPVTLGAVTAAQPSACAGGTVQLNGSATVSSSASSYAFAATSGTYNSITGGTVISDGSVTTLDSYVSGSITIPAFVFAGVTYTTAWMASNGSLNLGGAAPSTTSYNVISTTTASGISLAVFNADLHVVTSTTSSEMRWQQIGNEVIFQWKNFRRYLETGESISFQARLNTVTGVITYVYGGAPTFGSSISYQPIVGIRTSTTDFKNVQIGSGAATWASPNVGNANTDFCRFTTTSPSKVFVDGQTYSFTPPSLTYLWTKTDVSNFLSSTTITNPVATVNATDTYTFTATGSDGCFAAGNATINLGGGVPTVTALSSVPSICVGGSVTLSNTITGGCSPFTYSWSDGSTVVSTASSFPASPSSTKTYTLTVTDNNGSIVASGVTVTVNSLPTVTVNSGAFCSGGTAVALTASGASTYTWSPATNLSATTGASVNASPTVTRTYTVTGTDGNGCIATANSVVTYNETPTAVSIVQSPSAVCAGTVATLTASGGNANQPAFTDNFNALSSNFTTSAVGTGTPSAALNTTYFSQGTGSVLFTTASTSANIAYSLNSNLDLTSSTSAQLTFSHQALMESPTTSYDYGYVEYSADGGTTWTTFPTTSYAGAGTLFNSAVSFSTKSYADWILNFTSTSSLPLNSLWKTETINIPLAALTSQFRIRFRYTTDSGTNYYGWMIDDIKITKVAQTAITWTPITELYSNTGGTTPYVLNASSNVVYAKNTTATAYTATATNGTCTSSAIFSTIVNPVPTITLGTATAVCGGGTSSSLSFSATSGSPNQYTIDYDVTAESVGFNDVTTFTAFTTSPISLVVPTGAAAGTYSGTITVKNSTTGCVSTTYPFTVTIYAPVVITTPPNNSVSLEGADAIFSVVATGSGLTYQWQLNTGSGFANISGANSASYTELAVTAAMSGYQYQCIVSGTSPCSPVTSSIATLTISTTAITTQPATTTICSNESAVFTIATSGTTPTYQWQVSTNGGSTWADISGETGTTLTLTGLTSSSSTYKYRCSLNTGAIFSDAATLTVNDLVTISTPLSANTSACSNAANIPLSVSATGSGLTYQWKVNTGSGFANVASGGTSASYSVTPISNSLDLVQYQVIVSGLGTCVSQSSTTTLNITGVTVTSSITSNACLSDPFTLTVTPTASAPSMSYSWLSTAGSGASTAVTGSPASITPTISGSYTYTLTATGGGCTLTSTKAVTANAKPVITTYTASPATVCSGGSVAVAATSISSAAGIANSGAGATSSTTYHNPFYGLFSNIHTQHVILASELSAAGMVQGNITSFSMTFTTANSAALLDLSIKIGTTTATNASTYITSTVTPVYTSASFQSVVGVNSFNFISPYYWDGVSNLVLDFCYGNASTTATNVSTVNLDATSYVSSNYFRNTSAISGATACASSTLTGTYSARPQFKFSAQVGSNITSSLNWSWNTSPAITAATGSTTETNTTGSSINKIYTVTATNSTTGCSSTANTTSVTINSAPLAPTVTNSSQCGSQVPTASVADPNGYTSPIFKWYAANVGGVALQATTSTIYTTIVTGTTTFYVSVTNPTTGCESSRSAITITVTPSPAFALSSTTSANCAGAASTSPVTISTGTSDYDTYVWSPNPSTVTGDATTGWTFSPTVSTLYTLVASQSAGACSTTATVNITTTPASVGGTATASTSQLCNTGTSVLALTGNTGIIQWQSSPDNTVWTDVATGGTSANYTTPTLTSTTYFRANVTNSTCNSAQSNVLTINVNNPSVTIASPTAPTLCGSGSVTLNATGALGSTLTWYDAPSGGTVLGTGATYTTPTLTNSATYYVNSSYTTVTSGLGATGTPTPNNTLLSSERGIVISVTESGTLNSAQFYLASGAYAGTARLVNNSTGTQIISTPVSGTAASTGMQTVTLNWPMTAGTTYRLVFGMTTGSYVNNSTGVNYATAPWNNFGSSGTIISGYETSGASSSIYSSFYNMQYTKVCESSRSSVTVTVTPSPSVTLSGSTAAICNGSSTLTPVTLTAGAADYDAFTWLPATGVTGNSTSGWTFNPTTTTNYVLTGSNTATGCSNIASYAVTVNALPPSITVTPSTATICEGVIQNLAVNDGGYTQTLLSENFNSGIGIFTAVNASSSSNQDWAPQSNGYVYSSNAHTGSVLGFMMANSDIAGSGSTANTILVSPSFSTVGMTSISLTFKEFLNNSNDVAAIEISSDDFVTSTILRNQNSTDIGSASSFNSSTVAIPVSFENLPSVKIRFRYQGSWDFWWAVDEVVITGLGKIVTWTASSSPNFIFNDAAASVGYSGTASSTVYVKPNVSNIYTATSTNSFGCSTNATSVITVIAAPTAPTFTNSTQNCIGVPSASVVDVNGFTTPTFKWYTVATGGVAAQSSTSTTYTSSISTTTIFYVSVVNPVSGCESPRVAVTATVVPAPSFTLSSGSASICNGTPTATAITITTGASSYDTYTWSPSSVDITGDATTGWTFNPAATTNYTLNVSQSSGTCTNSAAVTITVKSLPAIPILTASTSTPCQNDVVTLNASSSTTGSAIVGISTGPGAAANTPYRQAVNATNQSRVQYLITKAELNAAGINEAVNLNSLGFNVSTVGAGAMASYTISMASTSLTALTATYQTPSFTTVYSGSNITPVAGLNAYTFSAPFAWDGTSNILVNICHSGAAGTASAVDSYTPSVVMTTSGSGNNQCNLTTGGATNVKKPVMYFGYTIVNPIAWTSTGTSDIFTNSPATTAYTTGANVGTVYIKTPITATYTATATGSNGCPNPTPQIITIQNATNATVASTVGSPLSVGDYLWNGKVSANWETVANWYSYDGTGFMIPTLSPDATNRVFVLTNVGAGSNCISTLNPATVNVIVGSGLAKDVFIGSGATMLIDPSKTLSVSGNWTNNGTFTPAADASVKFNGTGAQAIGGSSATTFTNLEVNKTAGLLTLNNAANISGLFTMTAGDILTTSSNLLTVGSSAATPGSLAWISGSVQGPIKRYFSGTASATAESGIFPVGLSGKNRYAQVNYTGGLTTGGSITAEYKIGSCPILYAGLPNSVDGQMIQNYENEGYWEITPNGGDLNTATYSIILRGNTLSTVTSTADMTKLRIIKSTSHTSWEMSGIGSNSGTTGGVTDFTIANTGMTGFSWFNIGSGNANPLPVTLVNFAANCNEKAQVDVTWTTASEQNSEIFKVERSRDLAQWELLTTLNAAGNSNFNIDYAILDTDPFSGVSYYRLVQIDDNGVETIYGPISVSCSDTENSMIVFPNPTKGNFIVEISSSESISNAQIQITDLTGKVINERSTNILEGKSQFTFEGLDLQLGTYIINLKTGNGKINPVRVVVN